MTENNAAQPGLTDDEIRAVWVEHGLDDEAVEDFARAIESSLLSKLRAPKPLGDSCHHCGWMDWVSQDGQAYCQACGKPHGSVPAEGLPNLPELLRENADLDEAEGGNAQVCALERDAADEIERLRREVAKLRAPVADERAEKLDAECNSLAHQLNASNERNGVLRAVLSDCSAELFAQCGDQPRAMSYVNAARGALASAPVAGATAEDAFDDGWREAANWSGREDLLADMDSFAYKAARARCVGKLDQLTAPQASEAVDRSPNLQGKPVDRSADLQCEGNSDLHFIAGTIALHLSGPLDPASLIAASRAIKDCIDRQASDAVRHAIETCAQICDGRSASLMQSQMLTASNEAHKCGMAIRSRGKELISLSLSAQPGAQRTGGSDA
jgi:hypothetical protein